MPENDFADNTITCELNKLHTILPSFTFLEYASFKDYIQLQVLKEKVISV